MKVLMIDDSPAALALAKTRLAKEGLDIACANGGKAGLEAAWRDRPDLILLDAEMPDMSGFDVCRALKAEVELCMIPVIFVSGSCNADDKVRGLDVGAVDYVTKPFDAFELRARVRAALRTKHLQDLLARHANVDSLTELFNRRALMDRLESEWGRIQRHGGSLSFIMADVDHFKRVNDTYGHSVGDRILREVARIFAEESRGADMPARYGGEEFVILCPGIDAADAAQLADRVRRRVEELAMGEYADRLRVTISCGVADTTESDSITAMIAAADQAMYKSKNAGRNTVTIATGKPEVVA